MKKKKKTRLTSQREHHIVNHSKMCCAHYVSIVRRRRRVVSFPFVMCTMNVPISIMCKTPVIYHCTVCFPHHRIRPIRCVLLPQSVQYRTSTVFTTFHSFIHLQCMLILHPHLHVRVIPFAAKCVPCRECLG